MPSIGPLRRSGSPGQRTHDRQPARKRAGEPAWDFEFGFRGQIAPLVRPPFRASQRRNRLMPIITNDPTIITQINVFTTTPENQQALIDILAEAARCASEVTGWRSASLHVSLDGTRVANYAQADSPEAMKAVFERLQSAGFMQRTSAIATAHPGLYKVAYTLER
jgi:hypothetical protein